MDLPPGIPGVSKDTPGSTEHAIWGLVRSIEEYLKKSREIGDFLTFFSNFDDFSKFVPF